MTKYVGLLTQANFMYLLGKTGQAILIIFITLLALRLGKIVIGRILNNQKASAAGVDYKRIETLKTICLSILKYVIYFIAFVTILKSVFNIDATTIVATAGIGGLAIGFGAQNLVKDVVSGFFILFEDQYRVGDKVTIGTFVGTVSEIGLRTTKIVNEEKDLCFIPNGEIKLVINHSREQIK